MTTSTIKANSSILTKQEYKENSAGEIIKLAKKRKNIKTVELSKLTGISHSFLSQIESSKYFPSEENIEILCEALSLNLELFKKKVNAEQIETEIEKLKIRIDKLTTRQQNYLIE